MAFLLDTNVLVRLANRADALWPIADGAVAKLFLRQGKLHITPQNLIEFRNVATRPQSVNGLAMAIPDAVNKIADFEKVFPLLADTPDIFPAWKALVAAAAVIGKQVHDARLVAVCHVHRVTHLLTFNMAHFQTLAGIGPGLVAVDPATV
jgi:predicted nucleic acid-binding protein